MQIWNLQPYHGEYYYFCCLHVRTCNYSGGDVWWVVGSQTLRNLFFRFFWAAKPPKRSEKRCFLQRLRPSKPPP